MSQSQPPAGRGRGARSTLPPRQTRGRGRVEGGLQSRLHLLQGYPQEEEGGGEVNDRSYSSSFHRTGSLLNPQRTTEAANAVSLASVAAMHNDHTDTDTDPDHDHDPLATPSRRSTAASTSNAVSNSLRYTAHGLRRHIAPPTRPALPEQYQQREVQEEEENESEEEVEVVEPFSSPPPVMTTLPVYSTPVDRPAPSAFRPPMGFDSPALHASPASPSWSSLDQPGLFLADTPEPFTPIRRSTTLSAASSSESITAVPVIIEAEDIYAEEIEEGQEETDESQAADTATTTYTTTTTVAPPAPRTPRTIATRLAGNATSRRQELDLSPRSRTAWREQATRIGAVLSSQFASPRTAEPTPALVASSLEASSQQRTPAAQVVPQDREPQEPRRLDRSRYLLHHPRQQRPPVDLQTTTRDHHQHVSTTIDTPPPRRLELVSLVPQRDSLPFGQRAPAIVPSPSRASVSPSAASSTISTTIARAPTSSSTARRLADDPDLFWSSSSTSSSTAAAAVAGQASLSSLSSHLRANRVAAAAAALRSAVAGRPVDNQFQRLSHAQERDRAMEGPRSRPPNADLFLRHLASLDQHDQQQQQQPSSQYRYDISEDPESGEDRNEYAEDEQGRVLEQEQMGGLHEQDYRQEEGVLEGEEEEVREEDGTAASNLSADILLDASKSYRKRYLSRAAAAASRRLPQEDEEDLPEETEEEEDPFNPVGSSSNSSLPSHRGHKRARLMMMMSGDEGSFHNSSFDDSFGQENHHDLQHTLPDQQQQQQQQLVDESEDSSLQVTVADSDVDGGHVSEQDDEGENELYEIYDPPSEAQLQETDAEEEEQDSQHQFGQQYHVLPPHAQTPGQPQYYQSTPGLTDNEEEHEDEIEVEETEVNVEEDEDDDEDENQRIEEEKMQQLVEASETESAETMAELCDFEAPGSILQGPALRQRLINEPEDQQAGRHENWEHQVVDEEIWWDLDPRALDAPHERLL